jgi:hypothetical protein
MRERYLDLQPHEIRGVIEAPLPTFADDRQPPRTNHRQEHRARPDRGCDLLNEIVAQRNRIDIPEDMVVTVVVNEPVKQPSGRVGRIFPPVADEDPGGRARSRFGHYFRLTASRGGSAPCP